MEYQRKIQLVANRVSFAEAEEADDIFWANATEQERLNELISLRIMFFGNGNGRRMRIKKVVTKRSLYEETED